MAQTAYDPRSAQAYANALLTQGANPLIDWFTNSQGGGLANWVDNQGKQIGNRIKNDLAYKIEHDDSLIDDVRTARNEGRDLRKELLQGYFINPYDETLNTAVDNLETKNTNRLNEAIAQSLMPKINADAYKGGNVIEEARNLGWNNLTKEQEAALKKYEQEALTKRYEEPLRKQIASQLIENPTYDPTGLVQEYNKLYGTQFNPADFTDTTSEKTKKYTNAASADIADKLFSSLTNLDDPTTYEQAQERLEHLKAIDSQNYDKYVRLGNVLEARRKKDIFDGFNEIYSDGIKYNKSLPEVFNALSQAMREKKIPIEYLNEFLKNNQTLSSYISSDAFTGHIKQEVQSLIADLDEFDKKYKTDPVAFSFIDQSQEIKVPSYVRDYERNPNVSDTVDRIRRQGVDPIRFLAWFAHKTGVDNKQKTLSDALENDNYTSYLEEYKGVIEKRKEKLDKISAAKGRLTYAEAVQAANIVENQLKNLK